jgi:hypothetical protein
MTKEEIFAVWSPEHSPWSTWVKPVLFAHLREEFTLPASHEIHRDVDWVPPATERYALVLDLPGDEGVWVGASLALRGYQPVPLYNAIPQPINAIPQPIHPALISISRLSIEAVNVLPILDALHGAAPQLSGIPVPPDAPPAFLLDANRLGGGTGPTDDMFDNRSVCFTTDFPSANFLLSKGIRRVLLVQRDRLEPHDDLAQVLRRWQDGGLRLERARIPAPTVRVPFQIARPRWYGAMFQRALAALGFRRAPAGGFGAWMPESSAGG